MYGGKEQRDSQPSQNVEESLLHNTSLTGRMELLSAATEKGRNKRIKDEKKEAQFYSAKLELPGHHELTCQGQSAAHSWIHHARTGVHS